MKKILLLLLTLTAFPAFSDPLDTSAGISEASLLPLAVRFPMDATPGCSIAAGYKALSQQYIGGASYCNIAFGYNVMKGKMTAAAVNNIGFGYSACGSLTSGANNICLGGAAGSVLNGAGGNTTTGSNNIFLGTGAGAKYTTGHDQIIMEGEGVVSGNGAASNNVMIDGHGGSVNSNSVMIAFDGQYAANFGGNYIMLIGFNTGRLNSNNGAAENNIIMIGDGTPTAPNTMDVATTTSNTVVDIGGAISGVGGSHPGIGDTGVGYDNLFTNAQDNARQAAFGYKSLYTSNVASAFNSAFGYQSCMTVTTGTSNVCLGYNAGSATLTTGSSNIIVGPSLTTLAAGTANEINIGGLLFYNNGSTAAPAISSCGTGSPSIDSKANDKSGTVTAGTVATTCTITFAAAYGTWNHCRVFSDNNTGFGYTYTTSAITVTAAALGGAVIEYDCDGV